ncbi:MAG: pseudouridine synthase [Cenarchaeum symbiont of Oopsacas minuta]|nr:pseudouridine synthase [Cenarchaeum symbiont of Oopsacas minuta]
MLNDNYEKALIVSKKITAQYDICDSCLGRSFAKNLSLSSPRRLGKKLRKEIRSIACKKCYICRGLFDDMKYANNLVLESASKYDFKTFLLGVTMRPSVVDRDDFIRSKFQLIGAESIKSAFAHDLSKMLSCNTKTTSRIESPDLFLTVNLRTGSTYARSKPVYVSGRYLKKERGLSQKLVKCLECNESGCKKCSGTKSIEAYISKYLCKIFLAERAKITWVGGEDKSSLILGSGRPFFAKLVNPKKRKPRMLKHHILEDNLTLLCLKNIKSAPKMPIKFHSIIEVSIKTKENILAQRLKLFDEIAGSTIAVYEKSRRNEKRVYSIRYKKTAPKSLSVTIKVDGGLPIKKFVTGDTVFPNISDLLETPCTCEYFDFHGVEVTA